MTFLYRRAVHAYSKRVFLMYITYVHAHIRIRVVLTDMLDKTAEPSRTAACGGGGLAQTRKCAELGRLAHAIHIRSCGMDMVVGVWMLTCVSSHVLHVSTYVE